MSKATFVTSALMIVIVSVGCSEPPAPLGALPKSKLSDWSADCDSTIDEEPAPKGKDPLMVGKRMREEVFRHAARRYVCKPPGWALYIAADDRVVGLCVDDDVRQHPMKSEIERARPLLTQHFGVERARQMTKGDCSFAPEKLANGFLRWSQELPAVVKPDGTFAYHPPVGTIRACCWEVIE